MHKTGHKSLDSEPEGKRSLCNRAQDFLRGGTDLGYYESKLAVYKVRLTALFALFKAVSYLQRTMIN